MPGARYYVQSWFERQAKQRRPQTFARWFLRVGKRNLAGLFLITRQAIRPSGGFLFTVVLEVCFNDILLILIDCFGNSYFHPRLYGRKIRTFFLKAIDRHLAQSISATVTISPGTLTLLHSYTGLCSMYCATALQLYVHLQPGLLRWSILGVLPSQFSCRYTACSPDFFTNSSSSSSSSTRAASLANH